VINCHLKGEKHEKEKYIRGYPHLREVMPWAGAALSVELYRKVGIEAAVGRDRLR